MSYLKYVKNISSTAVYNRGLVHYNKNNISNYSVNKIEQGFLIKGSIRGNYYYDLAVNLKVDNNGELYYRTKCTCPYNWGGECEHVVALLIKFFKEDYDFLKDEIIRERDYNRLLGLIDSDSHEDIFYYIRGFREEKLVNFKIYIRVSKSEDEKEYGNNQDEDSDTAKIIKEFMVGDTSRFHLLPVSDRHILNYLNDVSYSKGREGNTFLLPKTEENFIFLKNIAEEGKLFFEETKEQLKIGEKYDPEVVIEGDEEEIFINVKDDKRIYKSSKSELAWILKANIVHPLNNKRIIDLPDTIKIPMDKKGEFLFEIIPDLQKRYNLEVNGELSEYRLITIEPEVYLKLDNKEGKLYCAAKVIIADEVYTGAEILSINTDNREYNRSEEDEKVWYGRDYQSLKELINFLGDYEFHVRPDSFFINDEIDIQEFITNGLLYLNEEWNVEQTESFNNIEVKKVELEPVVELMDNDNEDKIDWFEFKVYYNLGGRTFNRKELQDMIRYNKSGEAYIQLDDNYYFLQEGKNEKTLKSMLYLANDNEGNYKSKFYNILYYKKLMEDSGIVFQGNKVYNQLEEDITGDSLIKKKPVPEEVKNLLREYQKEGYYWLHFLSKYYLGGILADDMGLGKTIQTLTLLKSLQLSKPALVVCPRTLIYNWAEEIEKFFPDFKYMVYYGTPEERDKMLEMFDEYELIISSYSIIARDCEDLNNTINSFSYCILDEAQHIKNHKTKRAKGVKEIKSKSRLALTGTPIENSAEELWSIFDFLMPGYLGSYTSFRKNYLIPFENNESGKMEELKKRVSPFILRRKKGEVLAELPEKMVNIQHVEMTKLQQDSYKVVLEEVRGEILNVVSEKGFNKSRIHILAALTRLRQICDHPALVLNKVDRKASSGKLDTLLEMVQEAVEGGHKIVVFSQFVKMLKLIRERFDVSKITYEYLDGSTHNRMERVNNFNENQDIKVFLISLRAGGVGLNLTSADIVIHVDPWWNPMVERQATDRVHRIGQKNKVMVYKMITGGTVEEKMLKLQKRKEKIFSNLIEESESNIQNITWEDIQELLQFN
ncbi:MAG: SNF2-related protein [Bacillota bacterium]